MCFTDSWNVVFSLLIALAISPFTALLIDTLTLLESVAGSCLCLIISISFLSQQKLGGKQLERPNDRPFLVKWKGFSQDHRLIGDLSHALPSPPSTQHKSHCPVQQMSWQFALTIYVVKSRLFICFKIKVCWEVGWKELLYIAHVHFGTTPESNQTGHISFLPGLNNLLGLEF